jgi:hypothetical protein
MRSEPTCNLVVRVPLSTKVAIERRADAIRREHPGLNVTLGGVVRDVLLRGLQEGSDVRPE